ncbi:hypothetical protein CR492_14250 [Methylocella silvestris]|uniref:RNA polymerase sigma factor 70 region 4 type 2 domain-containing protein n=2 Tax=Methylocella silvestris TaxID=199596 RepID=A0A2J7TEZ7_METSI|nr:hypothetical protein CR492_14250 [Methylocella silvestris]
MLIEANRDELRARAQATGSSIGQATGAAPGPNSSSFMPPPAAARTGAVFATDLHASEKTASAHTSTDAIGPALGALKLEEREALLLVALEGFSYVEAARILKISRPLLIARLSRARDRLPRDLSDGSPARRAKSQAPYLRLVK